jgi:hydroxymethylglutaryl-CoA reductase (NADPH)
MDVPTMVLKQLYDYGSLQNAGDGRGDVAFTIVNCLSDATFTGLDRVALDGAKVPLANLRLRVGHEEHDGNGEAVDPEAISEENPLAFDVQQTLDVVLEGRGPLDEGKHQIELAFQSKPFGALSFAVEDAIEGEGARRDTKIPRRDGEEDYTAAAVEERRRFVRDQTDADPEHLFSPSFEPEEAKGNVEHYTGVAQVPLGLAGPLRVNGEAAQGDFLIPMATSEGTLVASYNRGIKVLNASGGATATVVSDHMQRAPVFVFENARQARDFTHWVDDHMDAIREEAESTTSVGKLQFIDSYLSNQFAYLRFNYSTGDAAGQNMVGRATFAACSWIIDAYGEDRIDHFFLESNFATDKKASQVNVMRTRGKRVTAEATVERDALAQVMRVEPEVLDYHLGVATTGAFFSGANNNGAHSPNAITAMFIATGQDVANVSESSAAILYSEMTSAGDIYISLTIPSLIVATHGGGTGLPTQRECLKLLGCRGKGKVRKLAEIVAAVALAGEISLGSAISSSDWVSSHENYGRNR